MTDSFTSFMTFIIIVATMLLRTFEITYKSRSFKSKLSIIDEQCV